MCFVLLKCSSMAKPESSSAKSLSSQNASASPAKNRSRLSYKTICPVETLISLIQKYHPTADTKPVYKAYRMAEKAHHGQVRKNGSPYITHPFKVACILAELKLDLNTIISGLLHDVVEDTPVSLKDIETHFGKTVAFLVDGVSKISQIHFKDSHHQDSENMRKMIVAMARDVRVILVKLADRLHNMRTLQYMSSEKQLKVAKETLEIYAPLASRLGIQPIKVELEDLGFKYSDPEAFSQLEAHIDSEKKEIDIYINKVIRILEQEMQKQNGLKGEVSGRPKNMYSIFRKMQSQNLEYGQVYDVLAFRILVQKLEECYKVLGMVHALWKPIPGRFKDYIAIPKQNGYQSLHTTILGEEGKRFEVQIRTHDMHLLAERGIATHWKYKRESVEQNTDFISRETLQKFHWLQDLVSLHQQSTHFGEFFESIKLDLFDQEIFVFTPKGDVKVFPKGASPIDFAYAVHTDLGRQITGAKVNKKMVPISYKLKSGDSIEIITSRTQVPSDEWLKHCVTSKAKAKIKSFLKREKRKEAIEIGRALWEKECKAYGLKPDKVFESSRWKKYARDQGFSGDAGLYSHLGYGKALAKDVLKHIVPTLVQKESEPHSYTSITQTNSTQILKPQRKGKSKTQSPVIVEGMSGVMVHFAKCCSPLPGDAISGFISRGKGIVVHRHSCKLFLSMESDRYVYLKWNVHLSPSAGEGFDVSIRLISQDVPGVMKSISEVFAKQNVNMFNVKANATKDRKSICHCKIKVKDLSQLQFLMDSLKALRDVLSVTRL